MTGIRDHRFINFQRSDGQFRADEYRRHWQARLQELAGRQGLSREDGELRKVLSDEELSQLSGLLEQTKDPASRAHFETQFVQSLLNETQFVPSLYGTRGGQQKREVAADIMHAVMSEMAESAIAEAEPVMEGRGPMDVLFQSRAALQSAMTRMTNDGKYFSQADVEAFSEAQKNLLVATENADKLDAAALAGGYRMLQSGKELSGAQREALEKAEATRSSAQAAPAQSIRAAEAASAPGLVNGAPADGRTGLRALNATNDSDFMDYSTSLRQMPPARPGDRGEHVIELKSRITNALERLQSPPHELIAHLNKGTDLMDEKSVEALEYLQKQANLKVDGIAGDQTWAYLLSNGEIAADPGLKYVGSEPTDETRLLT